MNKKGLDRRSLPSLKARTSVEGFTLPEVLLAMVILATSMSLLSELQTKSIFRIFKAREEIDRVYLIKRRLYDLYFAKPEQEIGKEKKERIENPDLKLISHTMDINKKSVLKDFADRLRIIWSQGTWESQGKKNQMKMVSFILKPPREKKS